MPKTIEEKTKDEFLVCPKGHNVAVAPWNYARACTGQKDASGEEQHESGLYCIACDRAYGISELKNRK